jgi:hypothetical protein
VRTKAEQKFKRQGMRIVPNAWAHGPSTYSVSSLGSNKVQRAEVDQSLLSDWQTANAKIEQHKDLTRQFENWRRFLAAGAASLYAGFLEKRRKIKLPLYLTYDDAVFFGLLSGDD